MKHRLAQMQNDHPCFIGVRPWLEKFTLSKMTGAQQRLAAPRRSRVSFLNLMPQLRNRLHPLATVALAVGILFAAMTPDCLAQADSLPERVDFNFHIRPLLSDRCFKCHGPDEKSRKAGLRLDTLAGSRAVLDKKTGLRAIAPGKPEKSEVWRRIVTTDADNLMPPPNSHLSLNAEDIALIKKWIEQGAEYQPHWAFMPVKKVPVPKVNSDWPRNPIDRFVLDKLTQKNLPPAPEADKPTLLRRLALGLTGLPPSVEEIKAFLEDDAPDAYDKAVDRLLASPSYGERMANDWMDLARFADTYGYQNDVERDMSPWRDWVIRAFNQNLPYDQFVHWQLAGDLLRDATDEQTLATAFNRLHRMTNEGGSIEEEFRAENVADRVHTFGTAFLGLTLECARCHDHKYDPVSQRDYYSLFAFFNNIDESGLYSHFTRATPTPTLLRYAEGQKEKHAALKHAIAEQEAELKRMEKAARKRFEQRVKSGAAIHAASPSASFSFEEIKGNKTPDRARKHDATLAEAPQPTAGVHGQALRFNGENSVVFSGLGEFKRSDPFSFALWLKPGEPQERAVVFHRSRAWTDSGSRGYELLLDQGRPWFALVHFWPGNAIAIRARKAVSLNEWTHVAVTYDGSSRADGLRLYINGEAAACDVIRDHLYKDFVHRSEWGDSDVNNTPLTVGARFRDSGFKGGSVDEFQIFDAALTPFEARQLAGATVGKAAASRKANRIAPLAHQDTFAAWLNRDDTAYRTALNELKKRREAENQFANDIPEIMVMKELSVRRPTFVLKRGAYDAPGDAVEPGAPESVFSFSSNLPQNRLGLARWTTDPRNPLTARVAVNRLWKLHFGRGLVGTPEDFGSQGELPTHPELLDWLAREFVNNGWDIKALHRLIVTSAAYRQSSVASAELLALDPDNRLLARGPKQRLTAEQARDAALAASGLLARQVGGPSVKPYQPAGLWEQSGLHVKYTQDTGDKLYRRSLYTFWRRTSPPPTMLTFDATAREVCTAKREATSTPLQALVLMNDPQFVEAARVLAERVMKRHGKNTDMLLEDAFLAVLNRPALPQERVLARQLFEEQLAYFSKSKGASEQFLATGEFPRDKKLPLHRHAALAATVSVLMNHDEFILVR